MADTKTTIAIETTADTSGAEKADAALKNVGEAGKEAEAAGENLDKLGEKKGLLDKLAEGLSGELAKSIGLSGEAAEGFEKMAAPLLKSLGVWGLIGAAILKAFSAAQEYTAELNRQTVALDDAGFAQKKRSDELVRFLTTAKNAEEIGKRRLKLEEDLADAQQKANDAVTQGKKKEIEDSATIVAGLQTELRLTVAKEQSVRRAEAVQKAFADAQKALIPINQALADATEKRQEAETKKQAEILKATEAAQKAEAERLKPIKDILGALDQELAKRKELAALNAKNKAAEVAGPAADKITSLQGNISSLSKQRDNAADPELKAQYDAGIAAKQNELNRVQTEAQNALQKLAADVGSGIVQGATQTTQALTQTTADATSAKAQIDTAQTALTTAVQAIPPAVAPINAELVNLNANLGTAFSGILLAVQSNNTTLADVIRRVALLERRPANPGK